MVSVTGRYYAMDRDTRWERTQLAYEQLVGDGTGHGGPAGVEYIESQYAQGVTDEFLPPASIAAQPRPARAHRGRRLRGVLQLPPRPRPAAQPRARRQRLHRLRALTRAAQDLHFVTFTEYERDLAAEVAFPRQDVAHTLAEEVCAAGLQQFHVAETEKYAHVTYFINGGREDPFGGEERLLVPSPRVATYDTTPEMSAQAVTDAVVEHVERGDAMLSSWSTSPTPTWSGTPACSTPPCARWRSSTPAWIGSTRP